MRENNLTQGNVKKLFSLPFLAANLLQALYGATDLFVVGAYNGTSSISAVNIGSQLMQIITSFVISCSMDCTVLTGRQTEVNRQQKRSALFRQLLYFAIQNRKNLN